MNHHRLGITAVILLTILTGLYLYSHFTQKSPPPISEIPFNGLVPEEITHGDITKKQIIFTFDGGEGNQSALPILEILKKHHIHGTFFLTGKWVIKNEDLVRKMHTEGHEILNHTFDHPYLTTLASSSIQKELVDMDTIVTTLIGTSTKPYFRPPYGDRNAEVLKTAANIGYRSVYWTIDARDWMQSEGMTAEEVRSRILDNVSPGAIILMHVGDTITGEILDDVLTTLEERGYRMVSLKEGL